MATTYEVLSFIAGLMGVAACIVFGAASGLWLIGVAIWMGVFAVNAQIAENRAADRKAAQRRALLAPEQAPE